MQIEYNSDWMNPTIELIKCLNGVDSTTKNEEMGSIDYIIENETGKKLIRAMVNDDFSAATAYVDTIRATIKELNEKKFDEALILSKRITNSAFEIVATEENLNVITPKMKHNFRLVEIISAIQKKTRELCIITCGKALETRKECKGKRGRVYDCDIRRASDDANFHAKMKWKDVLLEDFHNLCIIENTIMEVN